MYSSPNAVQDPRVEQGVSLEPGQTLSPDFPPIVGEIDTLGRVYIQVGDKKVRVRSLTDPEFGLAPRVPRIVDVTPLATDDKTERPLKQLTFQPQTPAFLEYRSPPPPQLQTGREPWKEQIRELAAGLFGD